MAGTKGRHHRRRYASLLAALGMLALLGTAATAHAADAGGRIERVELRTAGLSTKVIVMLSRPIAFDVRVLDGDPAKNVGRRLVLDFSHTTIGPEATKPIDAGNDVLRQVRTGQFNAETARIVLELAGDAKHSVDAFESPPHVTITLGDDATVGTPATRDVDLLAPLEPVEPIGAAEAPKPAAPTVAAEPPPSTTAASSASESTKSAPRTIPLRARGRRPYSLNYTR